MADEVARLQAELTAARDAIRALEQTAQRHEQQISELQQRSAGADRPSPRPRRPEELDARDDDLAALAAAVLRAADLRSRHLPDAERARLVGGVDPWPEWERARHDKRMRAVALSARLATLAVEDPGHRDVAVGFRALQRELAALDASREETRAAAEYVKECAERIAADDGLRETDAAELAAGAQAQRQILVQARDRVVGAVERSAPLPPWFEAALGRAPHGHAEGWMTAAATLVAYRVTYAVHDRTRALGPEPTQEWPPSRRAEFFRLQRSLVLHRPPSSVSAHRPRKPAAVVVPALRPHPEA
ncbi:MULTISPECIES: hypothetical protein [unclassified Pseudonocardia]|jgi:hypothetical protein|uniref:hypothetical protein n=1 Tax=unclassified Pseudonocardia TaxID=2619320 RepID=UPI000963E9E0|nr:MULTISPECIES: hypothetical protein [unclassified Pseudonocardia]MBN9097519.1 hypothetical protein [Pseudonocardia sp.]OJY39843.1 MAG: hypothetical protein BGP03_21425 [Pseudonocardia sp. 73-21]